MYSVVICWSEADACRWISSLTKRYLDALKEKFLHRLLWLVFSLPALKNQKQRSYIEVFCLNRRLIISLSHTDTHTNPAAILSRTSRITHLSTPSIIQKKKKSAARSLWALLTSNVSSFEEKYTQNLWRFKDTSLHNLCARINRTENNCYPIKFT